MHMSMPICMPVPMSKSSSWPSPSSVVLVIVVIVVVVIVVVIAICLAITICNLWLVDHHHLQPIHIRNVRLKHGEYGKVQEPFHIAAAASAQCLGHGERI